MKLIFIILLIPVVSLAAKIPVDTFDQAKLETLVRNIPSSLVRTENHEGFVRKHYLFPNTKKASFSIKCQADYYGEATIPSFKSCELDISNKDFSGEETLFKIIDPTTVNSLRAAISYGSEIKSFYSFERLYGQAIDGTSKNIFRFTFICKTDACNVTIATKNPTP